MIDLTDVHKIYTRGTHTFTALESIHLHIASGDIVGVVGPSGAGKSTLLRTINMLTPPTRGEVTVHREHLTALGATRLRQIRQSIGMVFQHFNLLATATVYDNIALPLRLMNRPSAAIERRLHDLLHWLDLQHHAHKYPAQLSGGQKQRVGIGRAICGDVRVLLCDEATSALDPKSVDTILQLLRNIHQQMNMTLVVVTHDMRVVQRLCRRVIVMDAGKIVEHGSVTDVFAAPQHPVSQRLLCALDQDRAA